MRIVVVDGSIDFQCGKILPKQDRESFLGTELGQTASTRLVNKEWWHVTVKPEEGITATLLFRGDRLDRVFLLMEIPTDQKGEWTSENELERMRVHDSWLRQELGPPPYRYAWGEIASEYDQKGCVSEIIVVYEG